MHCLASPRRQCVSIRLFLETDRRCPDCPSAPSDAPTIASSPVSATVRPPARSLCSPRIRSVDFITWRRRRYRLCTLWERPTQFPFRSSKTQFGYKFISRRPCDARRGGRRGRRECRQADLLISATLRRADPHHYCVPRLRYEFYISI